MIQSPTWPPAPPAPDNRIHVWRRDPYLTRRAPQTGYYAVRKHTEFVRKFEVFPRELAL